MLWSPGVGTTEAWRAFDYPLWDLMGQHSGQPLYALAAAMAGHSVPVEWSAPCYDTSLYEDPVLYRELKAWRAGRGLAVLIADGEGDASAHLLEWAQDGLVDVVQYDIYDLGFSVWLRTGQHLDTLGVRSAPHHYSTGYGNYVACHLAAAIRHFTFVEWDEATVQGLDATGYTIDAGQVSVPTTPGFGLRLEEAVFQDAIRRGGGVL